MLDSNTVELSRYAMNLDGDWSFPSLGGVIRSYWDLYQLSAIVSYGDIDSLVDYTGIDPERLSTGQFDQRSLSPRLRSRFEAASVGPWSPSVLEAAPIEISRIEFSSPGFVEMIVMLPVAAVVRGLVMTAGYSVKQWYDLRLYIERSRADRSSEQLRRVRNESRIQRERWLGDEAELRSTISVVQDLDRLVHSDEYRRLHRMTGNERASLEILKAMNLKGSHIRPFVEAGLLDLPPVQDDSDQNYP